MKWIVISLLLASALIGRAEEPKIYWRDGQWEVYQARHWISYEHYCRQQHGLEAPPVGAIGKPNTAPGPANLQIGRPNTQPGPPNTQIGEPAGGIGRRNGIGKPNNEIGRTTIGLGEPNTSPGQTTIGIGRPNFEIGESNVAIGQTTIGIGRQMGGIGPANLGIGKR